MRSRVDSLDQDTIQINFKGSGEEERCCNDYAGKTESIIVWEQTYRPSTWEDCEILGCGTRAYFSFDGARPPYCLCAFECPSIWKTSHKFNAYLDEVPTAVVIKSKIFWDITPCSSETARSFGKKNISPPSLSPTSAGFLLGLLFDPEDGGDVPPKRRAVSELNRVTTQKTILFNVYLFNRVTSKELSVGQITQGRLVG
jgi:hypothetical protein